MPARRTLMRLCAPLALAVTAATALALAALRGAGLNGTPPPNATVIKKLIDDLTANWTWLIATGLGLVLIILAGLLMVGSRTAPDWLFKVVGGVLLILVVIPTVLA
jgi:type IV secretory pathway VirB2 component (pilin)